jgi:hypothetical protein
VIFLDLVTMRGRDVPKSELDNRSLLWYGYFALVAHVFGCIFPVYLFMAFRIWMSLIESFLADLFCSNTDNFLDIVFKKQNKLNN